MSTTEFKHELFEILDTLPHWQERYQTLREAAEAANALPEYYDYMHTLEGTIRRIQFDNIPDTVRANKLERRMRERMSKRAYRSATKEYDGE